MMKAKQRMPNNDWKKKKHLERLGNRRIITLNLAYC